jgi:hypothetical protein
VSDRLFRPVGLELEKVLSQRIIPQLESPEPTLNHDSSTNAVKLVERSTQIQEKPHFDTATTDAVAFSLRTGTA